MERLLDAMKQGQQGLPVNQEFWTDLAKFNEFMKSQRGDDPQTQELVEKLSDRLTGKLKDSPETRQALKRVLEDFNAELPRMSEEDQRFIWGFVKLLVDLQSLRHDLTAKTVQGEFTVEAAKSLLPQASGITNRDWGRIAARSSAPSLESLENKSLSLVLLTLEPLQAGKENAKKLDEFRLLGEAVPKPAELATMLRNSRDQGYATFLQPEFLTDVTAEVDGDTARGEAHFKAPKLYQGKVKYVARKRDGQWRIEEFHLPNFGISIHRNKDGIWERMTKARRAQPRPDGDTPARQEGEHMKRSHARDAAAEPEVVRGSNGNGTHE